MLEDKIFLITQSGKDFDCSVILVMIFSKNSFYFGLVSDLRLWINCSVPINGTLLIAMK